MNKLGYLILGFVCGVGLTNAVYGVANAAETPPPKEYTLKLTQAELDYIGGLLSEQKLKDVLTLWVKINGQVGDQNKAAPPPVGATGTEAK